VREIALHILDIVENGINAGADLVRITVEENRTENLLRISIGDNGRGMAKELLEKALDPFFTTRTTRRVGLGLSLFKEAAKRCEGNFEISSAEGKGTEVKASFRLNHIDLAPLGDMAGSLTSLIMGNPMVDFVYIHSMDGKEFRLDTKEIKKELEGGDITHPEVISFLGAFIRESLGDLRQQ
jgi:anti-sigma regulatory factor (Ser/Thr protein kinase)